MAEGNASVAALRFGRTMRRDLWWLQPLLTAAGLGAFVVYATWAAFQGAHYHLRPVPLAVLLARALRRLAARLVRAEAGLVAGLAALLAGAADPVGARAASASPATTTAAPTTRRSGPTRPSCAVGEPRKPLPRRGALPADPPERPPLLPLPRAAVPPRPRATTSGRRSGSPTADGRRRVRHRRRHARAARQRRPARRLHARLPLAAAPRRRLSATSSRRSRSA